LVERVMKIQNRLGLHARAAALFVQTANKYAAHVTIEKDGVEVNGKSIMGIMMLAAAKGSEVVIRADGADERDAAENIARLIDDKFHEEA
jgi:phosphocarrier protein HPr